LHLAAFARHVMRYSPRLLEMAAGLTLEEVRKLLDCSKLASATVRGFWGLDYVIRGQVLSA
jgi:hypothetical protein